MTKRTLTAAAFLLLGVTDSAGMTASVAHAQATTPSATSPSNSGTRDQARPPGSNATGRAGATDPIQPVPPRSNVVVPDGGMIAPPSSSTETSGTSTGTNSSGTLDTTGTAGTSDPTTRPRRVSPPRRPRSTPVESTPRSSGADSDAIDSPVPTPLTDRP